MERLLRQGCLKKSSTWALFKEMIGFAYPDLPVCAAVAMLLGFVLNRRYFAMAMENAKMVEKITERRRRKKLLRSAKQLAG